MGHFFRLKSLLCEAEGALLGSKGLRTLLLIIMRNATTGSPWPISNNPNACFNDPSLVGLCTLNTAILVPVTVGETRFLRNGISRLVAGPIAPGICKSSDDSLGSLTRQLPECTQFPRNRHLRLTSHKRTTRKRSYVGIEGRLGALWEKPHHAGGRGRGAGRGLLTLDKHILSVYTPYFKFSLQKKLRSGRERYG